ncbi:hypothetical protein H5410_042068 [Solanum commersonii]|uniref:Uncharacterized protein n=1 Tax=Solanum commersonii TaxID=4109 RepID=A0A9J5XUX5_SOLCO|nr:hypothetical protein H5410_042068 [Solanum commersonii]
MEALNIILGGQVWVLPTIYRGMPLGSQSMSKEIWSSVKEKCEKKLARWKGQYLSLEEDRGRSLIGQDRIRRKFLWQGNKDRKGYNMEVISPYRVNLWRSIRDWWDDFTIKTKVKVRNGEKTSGEMTGMRWDSKEYLPRYPQLNVKSTKNNCKNMYT